jgi:hypothetical protein
MSDPAAPKTVPQVFPKPTYFTPLALNARVFMLLAIALRLARSGVCNGSEVRIPVPAALLQGVLLLDGDLNVRPESLFCGGEYVRGTLRDSSAGLPAQIVAGALVGAENLE